MPQTSRRRAIALGYFISIQPIPSRDIYTRKSLRSYSAVASGIPLDIVLKMIVAPLSPRNSTSGNVAFESRQEILLL